MLTARTDCAEVVEAAEAARGDGFFCRACGAPVILRKGEVRVAHFAHRPDGACAWGASMSPEHLELQRRLADALRARGVHADLEVPAPSIVGDRRIDVLAWPPGRPRARVALEVQASELTQAEVAARSRSYQAAAIAPLWLRLLDFGEFRQVQTLPARGTVWIEQYRARAWERWAHDHLGGRLWFVDSGPFLAWRGAFAPAQAYDEAGGGAWREIVQWVDLELEGPFELAALRLNRGRIAGPDGTRRLAAWFVPPDESATAPRGPKVRWARGDDDGREELRLEARVGNGWVAVHTDGARGDWRSVRAAPAALIGAPPRALRRRPG